LECPQICKPIIKILVDKEGDLRKAAAEALGKLGYLQWKELIKEI